MFSNQSLRSTGLVLVIAMLVGCGHKADPFPPPLENPSRTTDLTVQQRGEAAILTFSYPSVTISGSPLEPLERVEVYRTKKDVSAFADVSEEATESTEESTPESSTPEEPAPAAPAPPVQPLEVLAATDPNEFLATATLLESFDEAAIEQATQGDQLVLRIELGSAGDEEIAHTFAIKTYVSDKLVSAYSNLVTLVQREAPPPPTDFQLTAEAEGIRLAWAEAESSEDEPVAFRVYRRSAQSRLYGPPLIRLPGTSIDYLDRSAVFGERYIYAVTALSHENPTVESFFGGEREIDYADRFAPTPPTELIALAEAGRVRLLWTASPEDDVLGYVVFRRRSGGDFRRLNDDSVLGVEYSDRTVEAGATYDYQVSAVDRSGNQSEASASVVARVP